MKHDVAVEVSNVSKLYRLGLKAEKSDSLAASAATFFKSPLKNFRKYRSLYRFRDSELDPNVEPGPDLLWAVRDVSFEVPRGQVLGIIGRNGAGKSTMLKILSRITTPTLGRVEIRGRVSSLLEVGTGFHNELTGRENVYLNGTILGMRKREVDRVFDAIVEFSGVGRFLDTPVKRYSSGMKVRLAFAVAAHLEPEILIVDEVLSVGDAEFQRRCIGKMESIGQEGRTILFVSHNMPAVTRMCQRVIMLQNGRTLLDGPPHDVVGAYLRAGAGRQAEAHWDDPAEAPGENLARLRSLSVRDSDGRVSEAMDIRKDFTVRIEFEVLEGGKVLFPAFSLWNEEGLAVFAAMDLDPKWRGRARPAGTYVCHARIPGNLLAEGTFFLNTALWQWEPRQRIEYHVKEAVTFQVVDTHEGDSARGDYIGGLSGVVRPKLDWTTDWTPGAADDRPSDAVIGAAGAD
jgi:lipopolysaccharide transport system ATP-binding protein